MKCPMCGKTSQLPVRPFCSKRCADLDLARWFNGTYAVPSNDPDDASALEEALDQERADGPHGKPH